MTKPLTQGLGRYVAIGTLAFAFGANAAPAMNDNQPDSFGSTNTTPVRLNLSKSGPVAPPQEESVIRVTGPVVPWTQAAVGPSGTLDYIRSGINHFNRAAPGEPIVLEINSPGGEWTTMLSVMNAMSMSANPVNTRCVGWAASAGAFMLMSGNYREAWSSCSLMIHNAQIKGGGDGGSQISAVDMIRKNIADNIDLERTLKRGVQIITENTGMSDELASAIMAQDCNMPLDAAKGLNIIDKIIDPKDPEVNNRKFVATADNVCIAVHFSDDIVKKMNDFIKAPKPARP